MLALITGVPGAKKTVFTVSKLDKIETQNKVNLSKNMQNYQNNLAKINGNDELINEFTYYHKEVGSGHTLKTVIEILPDDYFDFLTQEFDDLRPDYYFERTAIYNIIVERIALSDNVVLSFLQPVRTIYSNINALKIDFTRSLFDLTNEQGDIDWRNAPDGSIFAIDEIQLVEPFKDVRDKENPIIQDLSVHRHRGFDFYLITQSATNIHILLKDLIGLHWHVTIPWGWVSKVYQFGGYRQNPNTPSVKGSAEKVFRFNPPDRLFKLYKSTTIDTHEKRIPYKQLSIYAGMVVFAVVVFIYALGGAKDSNLVQGMTGNEVATMQPSPTEPPMQPSPTEPPMQPPTPLPQQQTDERLQAENEYLPSHFAQFKAERTTPAAVIKMGNKCIATNNRGEKLNIDNELCLLMASDSSMMPKAKSTPSANDVIFGATDVNYSY